MLPEGDYIVAGVWHNGDLWLARADDPHIRARVGWLGIRPTADAATWLRQQDVIRATVTWKLDRRRCARDGRLLGYISLQDRLLNADLLRAGLATQATDSVDYPPRVRQLQVAEAEARAARRGVWASHRASALSDG
jgi:hypothetical protein